MIQIDVTQSRAQGQVSQEKLNTIARQSVPAFASYEPPLGALKEVAARYAEYTHVIIVARGGSITSTEALYKNLSWYTSSKRVFFCNSTDPDFVQYLKSQCPPARTIVISVSKSGTNVEHLENTFAFAEHYRVLVVTSPDKNNPLLEAAHIKGWEVVDHPPVGGRFSAMTSSTLLPCAVIGMDVSAIVRDLRSAYTAYAPSVSLEKNDALRFAVQLYLLEQQGYDEIFFSLYSPQINGFSELISQLFHETVCKDGKQGQTVMALLSPESQHHFSQRFYGGKRNMIGVMVTVAQAAHDEARTQLPPEIQNLVLREGRLGDINNITLQQAILCEYEGNRSDAVGRGIPLMTITLPDTRETSTAGFLAFLQYASVYSAWLREVDPFNQPDVESSKLLSFQQRTRIAHAGGARA